MKTLKHGFFLVVVLYIISISIIPVSAINTMRIANAWDRWDGTFNSSTPENEFIYEMKNIGFNYILFAESGYPNQVSDLDYAMAHPDNNEIYKAVQRIHAAGMGAAFKMNPNRYGKDLQVGANANTDTKILFYNNQPYMDKFYYATKYLLDIGIDYVEIEEPFANKDLSVTQINFYRRLKKLFPPNVQLGFNWPTSNNISTDASGFTSDYNDGTFDIMFTSPNGDCTSQFDSVHGNSWMSTETMTNTYNYWRYVKLNDPKTIIGNTMFVSVTTPKVAPCNGLQLHNANLVENFRWATNNDYYLSAWPGRDMTSGEKTQVKALFAKYPQNPVVIISPTPTPTTSIINNGFESGTTSWMFYTSGTGTFSIASPGYEGNNAASLAFSSSGTNIQLYQNGITLEPNTLYRLSFTAYSTTGHDVTVNMVRAPVYLDYGLSYTANLGTNWQTFTTEFTTKGFTSTVNDGRLQFWLTPFAAAGDTYYIDNVRLEKVQAPVIVTQASNQNVEVGQSATFSVEATGNALSYQWQKNGVNVTGANNVTYTTPATALSDNGALFRIMIGNSAGSVTSNEASLIVSLASPSINLIGNPGFESGNALWSFYTSGTGNFGIASPGYEGSNSARLNLSSGGANIQLYQMGITLESNTSYRLSFAGYSTTGNDLTVNMIKHGSPYTFYGLVYTPDLGTNWRTFTTEFNTSGFTGTVNDGRLMFQLGPFAAVGDIYYIDNVRLEKLVNGGKSIYDLNNDGIVDTKDLSIVSSHYDKITTFPYPNYDINTDGKVDIFDLILVSKNMWSTS